MAKNESGGAWHPIRGRMDAGSRHGRCFPLQQNAGAPHAHGEKYLRYGCGRSPGENGKTESGENLHPKTESGLVAVPANFLNNWPSNQKLRSEIFPNIRNGGFLTIISINNAPIKFSGAGVKIISGESPIGGGSGAN